MTKKQKAQWRVEEVKGTVEITTPEGYRESVILREMTHTTDPPEHVFVIWLVTGRYGSKAPTISYEAKGAFSVRIDVPDDEKLSLKQLKKQLRAWWPDSGHLPDDPPGVKH
jgi:hypothetical protein